MRIAPGLLAMTKLADVGAGTLFHEPLAGSLAIAIEPFAEGDFSYLVSERGDLVLRSHSTKQPATVTHVAALRGAEFAFTADSVPQPPREFRYRDSYAGLATCLESGASLLVIKPNRIGHDNAEVSLADWSIIRTHEVSGRLLFGDWKLEFRTAPDEPWSELWAHKEAVPAT
jgi:hypothetical protein